jgi:Cell division GTPase
MSRTLVIGCGGAGCNTVSRIDADIPVLKMNTGSHGPDVKISMADSNVEGCRGDPDLGWALAFDCKDEIKKEMEGYKNIIVTAGLGGGTGSGAIPVISECARELGSKMISVVSIPMSFEKERRTRAVLQMEKVIEMSDRTVMFDIDRMPTMGGGPLKISDAIRSADEMMKEAIERVVNMLDGPFFSTLSKSVYTVAYSAGEDPANTALIAMDLCLFETDPGRGKIIVTSDSVISGAEEDMIMRLICDRTGIMPEVFQGRETNGHGMMLFIPISSRV